ncbi:serine/threonine protein kinase, partial [Thermodesulfobacteriota bacterium]
MKSVAKFEVDHLLGKHVGTSTLLEELDRGGMGIIFIAYQRTLKRRIAIKILPKSIITPEMSEIFQREAEAAAILSHPNIIPIYEVGKTEDFLFISMQLIDGKPLSKYIENAGKQLLPSRRILPLQTTFRLIFQILDALEYAHQQEIVHRDVKPDNILIEKHTQRPILMDFGLVKVMREEEKGGQSAVRGTPLYMPPEQILGRDIDHRADIYSIGVMLFEMLVSKLPLPEVESMFSLITLKLQKKSNYFEKLPSEMNSNLHPDIDRIVMKAIAFDPNDRYSTCKALT